MAGYILLVDDDQLHLDIYRERLVNAGFEVDCLTSGYDVVKTMQTRLPDLVVLDISMPGMTGMEVCQQIRANPGSESVPILMFTAHSHYESDALGMGADDYLTIDADRSVFLARVKRLLVRNYQQSELTDKLVELKADPVSTKSIEVFISYSHKDRKLRERLETHLAILKKQNIITAWSDRVIGPGDEWAGQIDDHLTSSRIILLLVSPDFINSDYCYDVEMKRALERHDEGKACVIPVILRPVDWTGAPFSKLNALPTDGKPLTEWQNRDRAFTTVTHGIRQAVREIIGEPKA